MMTPFLNLDTIQYLCLYILYYSIYSKKGIKKASLTSFLISEAFLLYIKLNIIYAYLSRSLANSKSPKVAEPLSATAGPTIKSFKSCVAT